MAKDQTSGEKQSSAAVEKLGQELSKLSHRAVREGVGPVSSSVAYAEQRLGSLNYDPEAAIRRVVRESIAASGTQGFVTGVGGLATLPVALPANLAGSLVINSRLVGTIAHLRGHDLKAPHVQSLIVLVAAGSSAQSSMSALGVQVGQRAALTAIQKIPVSVVRLINRRAGFALVAKYGTQRSAITLAKAVPIVGGVAGGSVDAALTASVAKVAKHVFHPVAGQSADSTVHSPPIDPDRSRQAQL